MYTLIYRVYTVLDSGWWTGAFGECEFPKSSLPRNTHLLPIPAKSSTRSERSRPAVPGHAVHPFRVMPSGCEG